MCTPASPNEDTVPARSPPPRILTRAACRTCKSCRRKKIRCSGERPKCQSCLSKNEDCEYPQDGRRAAVRGRNTEVENLREELKELKRLTRMLQAQHTPPEVSPGLGFNAANMESTGTRVNVDVQFDTELETNYPYVSLLGSSSSHKTPTMLRHHELRHTFAPSVSSRGSVVGNTPQQQNGDRLLSPGSSSDRSETRVYGATSLLHDKSSSTLLSAGPSPRETEDGGNLKIVAQRELISNAAIARQMESTIYSMPSVTANIDFDGVPMDLAMYLLNVHWNRQHLSYLVSYRPAIMDSLMSNGPYINKLLLNGIFFSTSLYSDCASLRTDPADPRTTGRSFYNRFKALLPQYLEAPTMPTIVALILCGASLVPNGEQGVGWLFCGMAYRMITDLGYHLDGSTSSQLNPNMRLSATEEEIRRRVYWGAYVCDTLQSLFLGRLPTFYKIESNVGHNYLDTYEEMEEWKPYIDAEARPFNAGVSDYQARPCYALSTFDNFRRLCGIANRIMDTFYSTIRSSPTEAEALESRNELRSLLEFWKQDLPLGLQFEPRTANTPPPHQITLYTTHYALVILTEQPFLKPGHFNFVPKPDCQADARERCIGAALSIWKLVEAYRETFTLRRAQYSISYATYCAVLVILQHAPRDREDYAQCIQFFWSALLEYQNGCSKGLKRPLEMLKSLMRCVEDVRQTVNVDELGGTTTQSGPNGNVWKGSAHDDVREGVDNTLQNWSALVCSDGLGIGNGDSMDWLDSMADGPSFTDDTVFGIFM